VSLSQRPFYSYKSNQFYREIRSGKMDPHGEIPTDNPCSAVINIEDELIPGEKIAELTERANNSLHDGRPE